VLVLAVDMLLPFAVFHMPAVVLQLPVVFVLLLLVVEFHKLVDVVPALVVFDMLLLSAGFLILVVV